MNEQALETQGVAATAGARKILKTFERHRRGHPRLVVRQPSSASTLGKLTGSGGGYPWHAILKNFSTISCSFGLVIPI